MFDILWCLIAFIITLFLLIIVHESGHFLVARYMGVKIKCFSIGFGSTLCSWKDRTGTEYKISLFPLGGFVKMFHKDEKSLSGLLSRNVQKNVILSSQLFSNKTLLQRLAIISAGPMSNFSFAILSYWLVFVFGVSTISPIVRSVTNDSRAFRAGIRTGMEIKTVADIETHDWNDVRIALLSQIGSQVKVRVLPFGDVINTKNINLKNFAINTDKQDILMQLGIHPYNYIILPIVSTITNNSTASKSKLHIGDELIKVNEHYFQNWGNFINFSRHHTHDKIILLVKRQGKIISLSLIPSSVRRWPWNYEPGFYGVLPSVVSLNSPYTNMIRKYDPLTSIAIAGKTVWQLSKITIRMMKNIVIGNIKVTNINGPLSIAQGAGIYAKYGCLSYLKFIALISINIAIINLLPVPGLDGGYLFFIILEKLKVLPLSEKYYILSYRIGSILLMLLMVIAIVNDVTHFLSFS
ncbi:MAG: RIP metalloprotease RseP [Candidatus Dasytiphilus stammeri]